MKMKEFLPDIDEKKMQEMVDIRALYDSGEISVQQAQDLLMQKVGVVTPAELAFAEQMVESDNSEECLNENLNRIRDLYGPLLKADRPTLSEGHPIDNYYRENDAVEEVVMQMKQLRKKPFIKNPWLEAFEKVEEFKIHQSRKQNQLYSLLEKKGFDRPTMTMWTYDNLVRDAITKQHDRIKNEEIEAFMADQDELEFALLDLMDKENTVLYPTSLSMINDEEFAEMVSGDREIGYCLIETPKDYIVGGAPQTEKGKGTAGVGSSEEDFADDLAALLAKHFPDKKLKQEDEVLDVAQGKLTLEQINLIFKHMPVDISYVDENELVKFYTDTKHRVFPRSKGVIGREVRHCHPPKSVHIVEEIIEKFRSGEKDETEFWINKPEFFIYIKYVAVRDENGKFRGVMEMMQDCTHIRALEGSRTLLTWEGESKEQYNEEAKDNVSTEQERGEEQNWNKDTRLKDLIDKYPQLQKDLATVDSKFKLLQTPMAKIMISQATLGKMSSISGKNLDELIKEIAKLIRTYR